MNRTIAFRSTTAFQAALERLGIRPGSEAALAVTATIRALAAASLPSPLDTFVLIPPTGRAYVRRVRNKNLWVWYAFDDDASRLLVITLQSSPPVPLDE